MKMRSMMWGLAVAATAMLAACSGSSGRKERLAYIERPAETIYSEAFESLEKKRLAEAVELFDEVERQHPYSEWARRSMLMAAYASYTSNDYETAVATAERYVALYPGGDSAAYAHYLIALSHYERIVDVGRDQRTTEQALSALENVARRYPESDYARDARLKIEMTRDHLAGKEMNIGRWYLRQGHHLAAINRFRTVIEEYQTTSHTPEALHRLAEAYMALGIVDEARQIAAVLGHNYPGERWYEDTYDLLAGQGVIIADSGEAAESAPRQRGWWGSTVGRFF